MKLKLDNREDLGRRASRRLRRDGRLPAVIYGGEGGNISVQVDAKEMEAVLDEGHHVIEVDAPTGSQQVLIRDLSWNHLGDTLLHVDFQRVDLDQELELDVVVRTKGDAPGAAKGGVLTLVRQELPVVCKAGAVPDAIIVDIGELEMNEAVHVGELDLPPGVRVDLDEDLTVVACVPPTEEEEEPEEEEVGEGLEEPEVITERKEEGEEGEEGEPAESADKGDGESDD